MFDRGQALRRGRHLDHQVLAIDVLPEPFGFGDGCLGVHRQIGRDFEADETVIAVQPVVHRAQDVGGVLDIFDRERLEQVGDGAVARLQGATDRAVIFVRTADRFFEDRRVRCHTLDAIGIDQRLEVALGDEAAGEEVEPDRLAMVFECFDGIHDACSLGSIDFGLPAAFGGRAGKSIFGWAQVAGRNGPIWNNITPFAPVRSKNIVCAPALILLGDPTGFGKWRQKRPRARSREVARNGSCAPHCPYACGRRYPHGGVASVRVQEPLRPHANDRDIQLDGAGETTAIKSPQ